jgi:hypothetical protein
VEALLEHVLAADVVLYDDPQVPDTGIFRGAEEFAARLRAIMEPLGHLQYEICTLEESGDYVLATVDLSIEGRSSGVALTLPQFHVSRWAGGRMRELRAYLDGDQARREYRRLSA